MSMAKEDRKETKSNVARGRKVAKEDRRETESKVASGRKVVDIAR